MTIQEQASLVVIGMNAGALIWGAATMSSAVKNLNAAVGEIKRDIRQIKTELGEALIELTRLQTEWDGHERRDGHDRRRLEN